MKYKLINQTTNEEHLCDKVTIDGFDYYVSEFSNESGGWNIDMEFLTLENPSRFNVVDQMKKVISTNNPNIDIPKVVDEVKKIGDELVSLSDLKSIDGSYNSYHYQVEAFLKGVKEGYNKSQETHPNSDEDMIEFGYWLLNDEDRPPFTNQSKKELLQIWKEQRIKVVYYQ